MYRQVTIPQSEIKDFCQPLYTRGLAEGLNYFLNTKNLLRT